LIEALAFGGILEHFVGFADLLELFFGVFALLTSGWYWRASFR
jgi:hypothetical protein